MIDAVVVHFANVVVHAARAQHRTGDAGVDGQFGGQVADTLGATDEDFVAEQQCLEFVEKVREADRRSVSPVEPPTLASQRQPPKRM